MEIPTKKLKSGFEMPIYGIGTWRMGGDRVRDPKNDDEADIGAIKKAIELGVVHIDTAETYADGYAERLVGEAIRGLERAKLFIVSKVRPEHLRYNDVIHAAKASLARIGTDYLDLYLIHKPNPLISIKATMEAMDWLVAEGLVKNIGVSNFTVESLKKAQSCSKNKIVANQVHYNLRFREPERKRLLPYCQKNDVMLVAWRPVEEGLLTEEGVAIIDEMVRKYQKTPAQITVNWLISQQAVVTLSKTRNIDHLKENLAAIGWKMKQEDVERLRREFPDQGDISNSVSLG